MGLAVLILVAETVLAFLAVDLSFRFIPVGEGLRLRLARWAKGYAVVAAGAAVTGWAVQWRLSGLAGLLVGVLNGAPWWLLWHYGIRKQFTFLFDGSAPGR